MLPISGETSIAPIMTGMELVFSPTDAIKMAQTMTTIFVPVTRPPDSSRSLISSLDAVSALICSIRDVMRLNLLLLFSWTS